MSHFCGAFHGSIVAMKSCGFPDLSPQPFVHAHAAHHARTRSRALSLGCRDEQRNHYDEPDPATAIFDSNMAAVTGDQFVHDGES